MRLIDADELRKRICKGFTQNEPDENPMVDLCECLADFISIIDEQPTAYDVDKVVHEINNKIQELDAKQQLFIENGLLNMADKMASKIGIYIECREIVEKAGVESE